MSETKATTGDSSAYRDPYVLTADAVQEPPASLLRALMRIGPGLILAASIVGTGELIATTHLGAKAGFALLWLVILSCFLKVFVQIELGRYAVSSGTTTLSAFRGLPGPGILLVWWWLIMMLVTQTQIGAMIGGIAHAMNRVAPVADELYYVLGVTWLTVALLAVGSYRLVERVATALVVTFTAVTVACVVLLWQSGNAFHTTDLAQGLTFAIPAGSITAAFAMIGITGVGASELIAYPYWCIEKGYARNVGPPDGSEAWRRRARGWLKVMQLDAWISLVVYTIATLAFFILGASVLHARTGGQGLPQNVAGMIDELEAMYVPALGPGAARWFIVVGAIAVLYSTLFSATAANSRTLTDFFRVNGMIRLPGVDDRRMWVRLWCVVLPLIGMSLYLVIGKPVLMVAIGGIIQAVTLPMIAAAALFLRYFRVDASLRPPRWWDLFLWLSLLALVAAAGYGLRTSVVTLFRQIVGGQ